MASFGNRQQSVHRKGLIVASSYVLLPTLCEPGRLYAR
jgi:hypothetical protein